MNPNLDRESEQITLKQFLNEKVPQKQSPNSISPDILTEMVRSTFKPACDTVTPSTKPTVNPTTQTQSKPQAQSKPQHQLKPQTQKSQTVNQPKVSDSFPYDYFKSLYGIPEVSKHQNAEDIAKILGDYAVSELLSNKDSNKITDQQKQYLKEKYFC
jgi:hypothetical protein